MLIDQEQGSRVVANSALRESSNEFLKLVVARLHTINGDGRIVEVAECVLEHRLET